MKKAKIIVAAVIAISTLIVILQNMENVTTKVLFWQVELPSVLVLAIILIVGFIMGLIVASVMAGKKKPR